MGLFSRRAAEKRTATLIFRCQPSLARQVEQLAARSGAPKSRVAETLLEFGLEVERRLDPVWGAIESHARSRGESFESAVARLVKAGLDSARSTGARRPKTR